MLESDENFFQGDTIKLPSLRRIPDIACPRFPILGKFLISFLLAVFVLQIFFDKLFPLLELLPFLSFLFVWFLLWLFLPRGTKLERYVIAKYGDFGILVIVSVSACLTLEILFPWLSISMGADPSIRFIFRLGFFLFWFFTWFFTLMASCTLVFVVLGILFSRLFGNFFLKSVLWMDRRRWFLGRRKLA